MEPVQIIAIAVALAMDAFAVAITAGVILKEISLRQNFRLAWHFGLFQALMPIVGWGAGQYIHHWVHAIAHWIAFGLLLFVAQGMIRSAFSCQPAETELKDPTKGATMVMLSIATSIDALAVGLSLSLLEVSIWIPALIIGLIAGGFTIVGMYLGKKLSQVPRLSCYAELTGGVVLLLIGVNLLREHGAFGAM